MIAFQGKYTADCKVFIDSIEETTQALIQSILDSPAFAGAKVRIMPDTHAGKGIVIGFTCPLDRYVCPSHVGVDIGCTIDSWVTNVHAGDVKLEKLERDIRKAVKFGQDYQERSVVEPKDFYKYANRLIRSWRSAWPEMIQDVHLDDEFVEAFCRRVGQDLKVFWKSLGTVGGGNHFIEVGAMPESGMLVYTIHTGSRNLGLKIAKYHESVAKTPAKTEEFRKARARLIAEYKATSRHSELNGALDDFRQHYTSANPEGYLTGQEMSDYLTDMAVGVAYAQYNHEVISRLVLNALQTQVKKAKVTDMVRSIHNYVDFTDHIIRKGAIRAYQGERCVIPFNMRDGLAICRGKSNADWNCSAPHGAGRVMSRAQAIKNLSVDEFRQQMEGIVSTSVGAGTIDEAPAAYKDTALVMSLIGDTVDIECLVKPLINLKDKKHRRRVKRLRGQAVTLTGLILNKKSCLV